MTPQPCARQACLTSTHVYERYDMSVYRLLEELVPFMDHSIDAPAATRMSSVSGMSTRL